MSFLLTFGSVSLDGVVSLTQRLEKRVWIERFPRRQGAIINRIPFEAERIVQIEYDVDKASESALTAYLDSLRKVFHFGQSQLIARNDNRRLNCVNTIFTESYQAGHTPAVRAFGQMEFRAADPHWYASGPSSTGPSGTTGFTIGSTNVGGVETPVDMRITARGANAVGVALFVENTTIGARCNWTGNIAQDADLIINTTGERFEVTSGGANAIGGFSGSNILFSIPGDNNWTFGVTAGTYATFDVIISWTPRWI